MLGLLTINAISTVPAPQVDAITGSVAKLGHEPIAHVVELLVDGDVVTVDGHLGIVTVGGADFDLEQRPTHN